MQGWRDYFISDNEGLTKLPATDIPMQAFLGVLGMPGMSAYTGLNKIAVCGLIKQYSATSPVPGPSNFAQILIKRLSVQGFIVFDHWSEYPAFVKQMSAWICSGKIQWEETVYHGLGQSIDALIGLFHGQNLGKMLAKLD